MTLKFSGKSTTGEDLITANRPWSTTEECDISCFKHEGVIAKCHEEFAVLSCSGAVDDPWRVHIFAVADNVYIAHQLGAAMITVFENLGDCLEVAAELTDTAER